MYNSLYYIFTKDYTDEYSNSTMYLKDKLNKQKILSDSKERELRYMKRKYDDLSRKYNELLMNLQDNRDKYYLLKEKYANAVAKVNTVSLDTNGDILCINDDYEHLWHTRETRETHIKHKRTQISNR